MVKKLVPSRIAARAANKQRELLTEIAPGIGAAALAIGVVWPACAAGFAVYGTLAVGALWTALEAVRLAHGAPAAMAAYRTL